MGGFENSHNGRNNFASQFMRTTVAKLKGSFLPFTYDVSAEVALTSGSIVDQLDDWSLPWFSETGNDSIITSVADSNAYTPSGVDKAFQIEFDAGGNCGIYHPLPADLDNTLTTIRLSVLFKTDATTPDRGLVVGLSDDGIADNSRVSWLATQYTGNAGDKIAGENNYGTANTYNEHGGNPVTETSPTRYHWLHSEWNWVANTVVATLVRAEDSSQIWTKSSVMGADGQTLGRLMDNIQNVTFWMAEGTTKIHIAKLWIGTLSDAWPV